MIKVSAPCKVHLLGEWAVVWGKPALLATVDLRMSAVVIARNPAKRRDDVAIFINQDRDAIARDDALQNLKKIIEPIIRKEFNIKIIPPYELKIESQIPMGCHLGSSAAVSVVSIAALLSHLNIKWDLDLVNKLAYEAEKVFHGNPSGADNATIVFGESIWYRKESADLKLIHLLPFSVPSKLADNFVLINTGRPKETTKDMVLLVKDLYEKKPKIVNTFLDNQEKLVRSLLDVLKNADENELIRIIKEGEQNLESIGVCSPQVKKIIRQIEASGGAAKICGAGASTGPTGILLTYHQDKKIIEKIAKGYGLNYFSTKLGVEGLRIEK